jgi:hypothetical protein
MRINSLFAISIIGHELQVIRQSYNAKDLQGFENL